MNSQDSVLRPGSIGGLKTYSPNELNTYINALIYGEPGIGKSTLAASACDVECMSPVLIADLEEGSKSIKGAYKDRSDITIVRPRTFDQLQALFDDLRKNSGLGFKTFVMDNATEGQKQGIDYILNGGKESTDFIDFEDPSWKNGAWNRSAEQMRKMTRYFKTLPMHVLFLSWRKDASKPDDKQVQWAPAFTPAILEQIPGMFDDVFYYRWKMLVNDKGKQERTRTIQTVTSIDATAKSRDGIGRKLPEYIRNPTMKKLCELWGVS